MVNYKDIAKKEILGEGGMLSPENLNEVSNLAGKSLGDFVQDKQARLTNIKDQYEGTIKENPISSVATAFAVGIVMGLLVRRN